ncbi:MFS transporter [Candidatus Bathyarchaeota archaeon]|nr:MAG: MFS transporter [Candidatus Bathyarchaeota archaeon]
MKIIPDLRLFNGNLRVLLVRRVLLAASGGLTAGLSTLYVKEVLGADAVILGLFGSIWSAVFVFFILMGGWIGDRYDRKKVLLMGTALTLPNPIIYALARDWHILILVNFLGALGSAISSPVYNAILYSSIEQRKRSQIVATLAVMASIVNMVVPPLSAYLVQTIGGLENLRIMFVAQFIISFLVWIYTFKRLKTMPSSERNEVKGMREAIEDMIFQMKRVYQMSRERKAFSWIIMFLLGPFAWQLVSPFWTIYAAEVCLAPLFIIGLLPTVDSLTRIFLQLPLANVSDRKGRKRIILMIRPFRYVAIATLVVGGSFQNPITPFIPLFVWMLDAIGTSTGSAFWALRTEVMPKKVQSTWNALLNFIWYIGSIPASLLGGFLWNIDPRLPFIVALFVDAGLRLPMLIYYVPETLVMLRKAPRIGPHILIYGLSEAGLTSTARLVQRSMKSEIISAARIDTKHISKILRSEKRPVIIEGTPALYAAKEEQDSVRVLLVASREERTRRRAQKAKKPEFVAFKELEEEDKKVNKIARRLYHADLSNMPPFDVAINTERVSPKKVAKIIAVLREKEEESE